MSRHNFPLIVPVAVHQTSVPHPGPEPAWTPHVSMSPADIRAYWVRYAPQATKGRKRR